MARVWYTFIFVFLCVNEGFCGPDYKAGFSSKAETCKDFTNDHFETDKMVLGQMDSEDEDGAGIMCMEGSIELKMEIDEGILINIDIEKETDAGSEPMMSAALDVCECIKDEGAPWYPIFQAMGMTTCPVAAGTYTVKNMTVDLDFTKDMLCHENVGDYMCKIKLVNARQDVISCHDMGLCVVET